MDYCAAIPYTSAAGVVPTNIVHAQRLSKQLRDLEIPFVDDFPAAEKSTDHIVDAIFGELRDVLYPRLPLH